jgi:gliding motility-associated-like protein
MTKKMKKLAFLFLIFLGFYASAQRANDCTDAIVVCGNTNISSNVSGFGIQELDATANACSYEELNSLWLSINIAVGGTLAFTLRPDSDDLVVDYDFYVFGPNSNCSNFNDPLRCSSTNPVQSGQTNNHTGLSDNESDQNEGPGELGNGFVSSIPVTAGEQYYILIDRPIGNGGFSLEWTGTAGFLPSPEANQPDNIEVCSTESNIEIDLTKQEPQITSSSTALITYHNSYADAFDYINDIRDADQFMYTGSATAIYVRVANPNGCFSITNFQVRPLAFDNPPSLNYTECDSDRDGTESFLLSQITTEIENSIGAVSQFDISLHENETDANSNTNVLPNATFTTATTEIFARISSNVLANCFISYPINLNVIEDPYPASFNLVQCDVDVGNSLDGITRMDLEQVFAGVTGVQISYYETVADRNANNPIINPSDYTNQVAFNDTIYYRIISDICESTGEIVLEINPTIVSLNTTSPLMVCGGDTDITASEGSFDIEGIRQASYAGLEVAFYGNRIDLALEQNPISGNIISETMTLYIRLETSNQCQGVEEIGLVVNRLPTISLENDYEVCTDGQPLVIDAPAGFDSYIWYKTDTNSNEEIGNSAQVSITEGGNYHLEVGTTYENNGQTISCYSTTDFVVTPSNRAIIQQIEINDASDNNSFEMSVSGDGDYEFSIDNENYQDEPLFENLDAGFFTVYVRDKNDCGITEEEIALIGFPKFFTPNGDGAHENWQIIGAAEGLLTATVTIYDRYGKLLRQFDTADLGWDGTMNGRQLPASDYWFKVDFLDGKQFKGHFTLKR